MKTRPCSNPECLVLHLEDDKPLFETTKHICPKCNLEIHDMVAHHLCRPNSDQTFKKDAGKPRWDLLPVDAIKEVLKVLEKGAVKYSPNGWRNNPGEHMRLYRAGIGHGMDAMNGQDFDPEFGTYHIANAICCYLFLLEYNLKGLGKDDRYRHPEGTEGAKG